MAVKAALFSTLIPKISVTAVDGGEPELELSDDPYDGNKLIELLERAPVLVTLSRIGNFCVVDPTPEEEACSSASLVISVTPKGNNNNSVKLGCSFCCISKNHCCSHADNSANLSFFRKNHHCSQNGIWMFP